ncbi:hypothetical protein BDV96DRAFT_192383 [Lophiotrema nucula]|uniref:Uncharacterized protein n=1 Tax=Lophiotrema nucula TaxID=690887 RepID=A0A6A5YUX5_9PLEO|nr:hypothetical protein BDV96DRAFT_192383 [Lophiotrema nucula]
MFRCAGRMWEVGSGSGAADEVGTGVRQHGAKQSSAIRHGWRARCNSGGSAMQDARQRRSEQCEDCNGAELARLVLRSAVERQHGLAAKGQSSWHRRFRTTTTRGAEAKRKSPNREKTAAVCCN